MHHSSNNRGLKVTIVILVLLLAAGIWYHEDTLGRAESRLRDASAELARVNGDSAPVPETPTPSTGTAEPDTTELASYTSKAYNFSVMYPAAYEFKVYNDKNMTIGNVTGSGIEEIVDGKVDLSIATADTTEESRSGIEDFIFNKAKLLCDADGRGAHISCPRQKSIEPLKLASGLSAYTLTLEEETEITGPEASLTKQDRRMYVVDLGKNSKRKILIIKAVGDGTDQMAEKVALSVK